jgi:hypothetical protein
MKEICFARFTLRDVYEKYIFRFNWIRLILLAYLVAKYKDLVFLLLSIVKKEVTLDIRKILSV